MKVNVYGKIPLFINTVVTPTAFPSAGTLAAFPGSSCFTKIAKSQGPASCDRNSWEPQWRVMWQT